VGANPQRLALGEQLGADLIVDVSKEIASEAIARHGGASVVIEATGNPTALAEAMRATAPGGRIVLQGIFAGQKLDGFDLDRVVLNDMTIRGALGSPGVWPDVIRLIERGRIDPGRLVTHQLELMEYPRAIELVKQRRGVKTIVRAKI
jgi:threonine dehydrogenase-like Zn-dependent dehydrogenase